MMRPSVSPVFLAVLALVSCGGSHSTVSVRTAAAPPDARVAWLAQRRIEERLVGGVDYFMRGAPARPELRVAAWGASQAGQQFCERGRPGFHCLDSSVARFTAVFFQTLASQNVAVSSKVAWTVVAPPHCALVVAALGDLAPPAATLHATLTLDACQVTSTHKAWRLAYRDAPSGICPDGSRATHLSIGDPGENMPRQQSPPVCPCFEALQPTRFAVRGRWSFGKWTQPFAAIREGVGSLVSQTRATEPTDLPLATVVANQVQGSLAFAALTAEVLGATDLDDRAVSCARIHSAQPGDLFDAHLLEPTRCEGVFERTPVPFVAPAPGPPAPPPSISPDAYPHQLAIIDPPLRAATSADLAHRAPGWTFKVNALGFVSEAMFAQRGLDEKAMGAALATLVAVGHRYLGFAAPPKVVRSGEGPSGPQFSLVDTNRPDSFLWVRIDGRGIVVEGHAWPLTCPAIQQSPEALFKPWIGQWMTTKVLGHPCDQAGNYSCVSSAPTTERRRVTRRDLGIVALTVLRRGARTDELELHCAYAIQLHNNGKLTKPLPGPIDVVTGAALSGIVTEDNLGP